MNRKRGGKERKQNEGIKKKNMNIKEKIARQ